MACSSKWLDVFVSSEEEKDGKDDEFVCSVQSGRWLPERRYKVTYEEGNGESSMTVPIVMNESIRYIRDSGIFSTQTSNQMTNDKQDLRWKLKREYTRSFHEGSLTATQKKLNYTTDVSVEYDALPSISNLKTTQSIFWARRYKYTATGDEGTGPIATSTYATFPIQRVRNYVPYGHFEAKCSDGPYGQALNDFINGRSVNLTQSSGTNAALFNNAIQNRNTADPLFIHRGAGYYEWPQDALLRLGANGGGGFDDFSFFKMQRSTNADEHLRKWEKRRLDGSGADLRYHKIAIKDESGEWWVPVSSQESNLGNDNFFIYDKSVVGSRLKIDSSKPFIISERVLTNGHSQYWQGVYTFMKYVETDYAKNSGTGTYVGGWSDSQWIYKGLDFYVVDNVYGFGGTTSLAGRQYSNAANFNKSERDVSLVLLGTDEENRGSYFHSGVSSTASSRNYNSSTLSKPASVEDNPTPPASITDYIYQDIRLNWGVYFQIGGTYTGSDPNALKSVLFQFKAAEIVDDGKFVRYKNGLLAFINDSSVKIDENSSYTNDTSAGTAHLNIYLYKDDGSVGTSLVNTLNAVSHSNHNYDGITAASVEWTDVAELGWRIPYVTSAQFMTPHSLPASSDASTGDFKLFLFEHTLPTVDHNKSITQRTMGTKNTDASNKSFTTADYVARTSTGATTSKAGIQYGQGSIFDFTRTGSLLPPGHVRNSINSYKPDNSPAKYSVTIEVAGADWIDLGGNKNSSSSDWANATSSSTYRGTELSSLAMDFLAYDTGIVSYDSSSQLVTPSITYASSHATTVNKSAFTRSNTFLQADNRSLQSADAYADNFLIAEGDYETVTEADVGIDFTKASLVDYSAQNIRKYTFDHNRGDVTIGKYKEGSTYREFNVSNSKLKDLDFPVNWVGSKKVINGKYSDWQYFMTEVELIHSRFESADPYSAGTDYPRIISVGSNHRNSLTDGRSYIVNPQAWNDFNGDPVKWFVNRRDSSTLSSGWNSHSPDTQFAVLSTGGSSSINTSWKYGQLPFHEDKYEFVVTKTTETNRNWETIADPNASTQKVTTLWDPMLYVIVFTDTDIRDSSTLAVPQSVIDSFISAIPLPTGISSIPAGRVSITTNGSTKQHQIILRVDGWIEADGTTVSTECFMDHAYFALRAKLSKSRDFTTHLSSSFGTATQDPSFVKRYFPTNHSDLLSSSLNNAIAFGTGWQKAGKTATFYNQFTNTNTYDMYSVASTVIIPTTDALKKQGITYPIHFYESGRGNKSELLRQDFTDSVASARPSVTRASKQLYEVTVNYRDADNNAGGYKGDITSVNTLIKWHWLQTMTVFMKATGTISSWLAGGISDTYGDPAAITFVNREEWNPSTQTASSYTANWSVHPYYTTVVKVSPNTTTNTTWYDSSVDNQLRLVTNNFQHLKVLTTYNALQLTGPIINTATTNWDSSSPSPADTFSGNNISDTYYDDVNVVYEYEDTADIKSILNPLFTNANHLLIPAVEYKLYVQDATALTASQLADIRSSLSIAISNVDSSVGSSDFTKTLDELETSTDPSFTLLYLIYTLRSTDEAKIRKVYQALTKTDANGALVHDVWTVYDGVSGSSSSGISSSTPSETSFKFKLDKVYNAQTGFSVVPTTAAVFQDLSTTPIPTTSAYLSEGYTKKTVLIGGFPVQSSNAAFDNVSWATRPAQSSGELFETASYNASTYTHPSYVITETYTSGASTQYESIFSANESIRAANPLKSGMFVKIDTLKLGTFGLSKANNKYSSWDTFSLTTPSGLQASDLGGKEGSGSVYTWSNVPSNSGSKMKKEFLGFAWPGQDLHIGPYGPNVPKAFSDVDPHYLALTPNVTTSDVSAVGTNGTVIEEQGKFVIEETNSNWLIPTWTKDYESSNFTFPLQVGDMIRVGSNDHKGATTSYCRVMEIREAEYIVNGTSGNLMLATDGGTQTTYPATSTNSAHIPELASTSYHEPTFPTDCLKTGTTRATYRGNVTGDGTKHASAQKQTLTPAGGDPGPGAVLNDALAVYTESSAQVQYNYEGHLSNQSARAIAKTGIARYCIRIDMSINATTVPRENLGQCALDDPGNARKDLRQWVNTDEGSDTAGNLFNRHLLSSGSGQGLNNYERYFYPMYKMKMIPRTVTARLDNGIKSIKELVLVGYSLTPHEHREEHGHEVSREQLILLRLNEVDGSVVSNSAQAKGTLAVLFRDEKGGKRFDYDNGIIRVPVNGAVRNLTFTATDIDGKPAKIGRLNLWLKLHVNF